MLACSEDPRSGDIALKALEVSIQAIVAGRMPSDLSPMLLESPQWNS